MVYKRFIKGFLELSIHQRILKKKKMYRVSTKIFNIDNKKKCRNVSRAPNQLITMISKELSD